MTTERGETLMFTRRDFMVGTGAVLTSTALARNASAATNLDLATVWPDGNFHTTNAKKFAEEVGKATGGEVKITVQAGGSLGFKGPEQLRAVRDGRHGAGADPVGRDDPGARLRRRRGRVDLGGVGRRRQVLGIPEIYLPDQPHLVVPDGQRQQRHLEEVFSPTPEGDRGTGEEA